MGSDSSTNSRRPLERGHIRLKLIRDLAAGEEPSTELGKRYGVTSSAIRQFAKRHEFDIAQVRAKLDDEFAGLWIADKAARISEYEQQYADLQDMIDERADLLAGLVEKAEQVDPGDVEAVAAAREILDAVARMRVELLVGRQQVALHNVAEELGHLPQRLAVQMSGEVVTYRVEGLDTETLK